MFLVSLNAHGSTVFQDYIQRCKNVYSFGGEGNSLHLIVRNIDNIQIPYSQNVLYGDAIPLLKDYGNPSVFCTFLDKVSDIQNPHKYNFELMKSRWMKLWMIFRDYTDNKDAILFQKSPANTVRFQGMYDTFKPATFIFMSRNPYAFTGSLLYTNPHFGIKDIINHWGIGTQLNVNHHFNTDVESMLITYEDMCTNPAFLTHQLKELNENLYDLNFNDGRLQSTNFQRINSLTRTQIYEIYQYLEPYKDTMKCLDYDRVNNKKHLIELITERERV